MLFFVMFQRKCDVTMMRNFRQLRGQLCSSIRWSIGSLILIICVPSFITIVHSQSSECPPSETIPGCPCYNFENGLFLECAGATEETIRSTLQKIVTNAGITKKKLINLQILFTCITI